MNKNKSVFYKIMKYGVIIPALANFITFKLLEGPLASKYKSYYYNWKYGNIRFVKKGKGKPILLIHGVGAGANLDEWEECISILSKSYKVYALDLLGFGNSDRPALTYSAYLYQELVNDFISDVIKEPAYIISQSNCASFAVMAHKFNPENIEKIMLISPTGLDSNMPNPIRPIMGKIMDTPHLGTSLFNIVASLPGTYLFFKKYIYADPSKVTWEITKKYHKSAHSGGVNSRYPISSLLMGQYDINICKALKEITIPVSVVWGEDNILNPVNNIVYIKGINPGIPINIMEGAKLIPHAENPTKFTNICKEFFGQ